MQSTEFDGIRILKLVYNTHLMIMERETKPRSAGLTDLAEVIARTPFVKRRYLDIISRADPKDLQYLKPRKTLIASLASLEKYSGMKIEEIHNNGLLIPAVYMYWALACGWDDCMDNEGRLSDDALNKKDNNGTSARSVWMRGINLIKANPNIQENSKGILIGELEKAKEKYIENEAGLKNQELFIGKKPKEVLALVTQMREGSFGNTARVMTRVFTKGERNAAFEDKMARVTLALGIVDGFMDLKEDTANGTMTEARALLAVHGNNKDAIVHGVEIVKKLVG